MRNAWTGLGSYYGAVATDLVVAGARCDDAPYRRLFDSAVCTDLDDDLAVGGLGRTWTILDSYLKPYACARWIHPALDATRIALAEAYGGRARGTVAVDPADVEKVEVETFAFAASLSATEVIVRYASTSRVLTALSAVNAGPFGIATGPVARNR